MEQFKQFILRHFEKILVAVILIAALIGTYVVEEKFIILNFYYLPVLTAGYFLGRRMGVLASVFSILAVLICVLVFPRRFLGERKYDRRGATFLVGRVSHFGEFHRWDSIRKK